MSFEIKKYHTISEIEKERKRRKEERNEFKWNKTFSLSIYEHRNVNESHLLEVVECLWRMLVLIICESGVTVHAIKQRPQSLQSF